MVRQRVRIRFCKQDDLRLISHRDLARTIERLLRRAELSLSMSEGFHPKPRISFPSALALGIRGADEILQIELTDRPDAGELLDRLRKQAPPGLVLKSLELLPDGAKKPRVEFASYEFPVPAERQAALDAKVAEILALASLCVERPGRSEPIDLRADIDRLELVDGTLQMRLRVSEGANARPQEVLEALRLADLLEEGCYLTRSEVTLTRASSAGSAALPQSGPPDANAQDPSVSQLCRTRKQSL